MTAEAEITAAYTDLKAAHELITGAQETLQQIVDRIPKLIELVNKYNAAFETWSGDVDTHKNKGSDLIDSDHQEIQVIKGEISEDAVDISTEGLVRVDIKETDVENFKTRLQNTIDLLQSYRETIESVRYRGTTIIGEDVVEKPLTGDGGINTFDRFESAATSQKNGCTAPVVEKAKISVYHDTKGEDKGIDRVYRRNLGNNRWA